MNSVRFDNQRVGYSMEALRANLHADYFCPYQNGVNFLEANVFLKNSSRKYFLLKNQHYANLLQAVTGVLKNYVWLVILLDIFVLPTDL